MRALDLFAGTGWGVACQQLGIEEMGVELMEEAVATREANGMATLYRDVWEGLGGESLAYDLLIASPPCQTFSLAGSGAGRRALGEVVAAIEAGIYRDPAALRAFGEVHDPRTALVLTPLAHVWRDMPQSVVLEQVPSVLPVWEAYAAVLRSWGYSVVTGILNAEQYGVPQTRRRAILAASLSRPAELPAPTHSRYYSRDPERLDPGVLPWVSMAEALGQDDGLIFRNGNQRNAAKRPMGAPAPTIMFAARSNKVEWMDAALAADPAASGVRVTVEEAAALQSYPVGWGYTNRPAPTFCNSGHGGAGIEWGGNSTRKGMRAASASGEGWAAKPGVAPGSNDAIRVSPTEAAALQSYPGPFVWCGTKTKQYLQIGNAVPPLLGLHVLAAAVAGVRAVAA